ncbi:hypothetical protein AOLI_G00216250 [Acnodon oligacanthus]
MSPVREKTPQKVSGSPQSQLRRENCGWRCKSVRARWRDMIQAGRSAFSGEKLREPRGAQSSEGQAVQFGLSAFRCETALNVEFGLLQREPEGIRTDSGSESCRLLQLLLYFGLFVVCRERRAAERSRSGGSQQGMTPREP